MPPSSRGRGRGHAGVRETAEQLDRRRPERPSTLLATFAALLLLLEVDPWSEAFMRLASRQPPPAEEASPDQPKADYILGNVWQNRTWKRAIEVDPQSARGPMAEGDDLHMRKLLVPMRLEDIQFLGQLKLEQIQVDLWPHRDPTPHVHVRIQTNAIRLPLRNPQPKFLQRFLGESQTWLTLFESIVQMSKGVALMNCRSDWRWADFAWAEFNERQLTWRQAITPPIRILEVTCPLRPKGFLLPGPIMGPPAGPQNWRDVVMTCCRFAFVAILVMVCVAQVILLMGCIAMLVMQIGMQWRVIQ